jgi:hypothetical protein
MYENNIEARLTRLEAKIDQLLNATLVNCVEDIDAHFELGRRAGKGAKDILAEINQKFDRSGGTR